MIDEQTIIDIDDKPIKLPITDKDKEKFLKAVLSNEAYVETIPLFGGRHKLTFKAITVEENEDVLKQAKLDEKSGVASNDNGYFVQLVSYRLALGLVKADDTDFLPEVTKATFKPTDKDTYVSAKAKDFKSWQAFKLSAYIDAFNQFEDKIIRLGKEIRNESFWTASG